MIACETLIMTMTILWLELEIIVGTPTLVPECNVVRPEGRTASTLSLGNPRDRLTFVLQYVHPDQLGDVILQLVFVAVVDLKTEGKLRHSVGLVQSCEGV